MDLFYNRTVTIFNHAESSDVLGDDLWFVTLLENVRILETHGANVASTGMADADSVKLHIRLDGLEKPYLDPIKWSELLDRTEAFTLNPESDFFVVGDVSDAAPGRYDLFDYMEKNYDGVYRITNVDKYGLIPHLEVGGK